MLGPHDLLEEKLLRRGLFEEFCEEFTREMNRLRGQHRATLLSAGREVARLEARRKKLIEMVMEAGAARREEFELQIELRGSLAAMLGATRQTKRPSESDDLSLQVSLVAEARNHLNLAFR